MTTITGVGEMARMFWGYTIFRVVFTVSVRQHCVAGGPVDFTQYPDGKGPKDAHLL